MRGAGFDTATNDDPCGPRWGRNKDGARHLSWRTAILSPSPRAWPFNVGRSRYADRLRPNFLLKPSEGAIHTIRRAFVLGLLAEAAESAKLPRHSATASAPHYNVAWRSLG